MTSTERVRAKLIDSGVKNLRAFGYPKVDAKNILTDLIYASFFDSMLRDNLGHSGTIDDQIHELRHEIAKAKKAK